MRPVVLVDDDAVQRVQTEGSALIHPVPQHVRQHRAVDDLGIHLDGTVAVERHRIVHRRLEVCRVQLDGLRGAAAVLEVGRHRYGLALERVEHRIGRRKWVFRGFDRVAVILVGPQAEALRVAVIVRADRQVDSGTEHFREAHRHVTIGIGQAKSVDHLHALVLSVMIAQARLLRFPCSDLGHALRIVSPVDGLVAVAVEHPRRGGGLDAYDALALHGEHAAGVLPVLQVPILRWRGQAAGAVEHDHPVIGRRNQRARVRRVRPHGERLTRNGAAMATHIAQHVEELAAKRHERRHDRKRARPRGDRPPPKPPDDRRRRAVARTRRRISGRARSARMRCATLPTLLAARAFDLGEDALMHRTRALDFLHQSTILVHRRRLHEIPPVLSTS